MNNPTLRDIAREAGVSPTAVSMALRGRPGVSPARAEAIRGIARRLGYEADAAASILATRRHAPGAASAPAALSVAFLSARSGFFPHFESAARSLGLAASFTDLASLPSPDRAPRILWARGIQGICLNLLPSHQPWIDSLLSIPAWHRFSLVKHNRSPAELPLHLVRHNAYDYMHRALEQVFARRYHRVAVLLFDSHSPLDDDSRLGAVLSFQIRRLPPGTRLFWRHCPRRDAYPLHPDDLRWLRRQKPDAVLSLYAHALYSLRENGWRIPETLGFAAVLARPDADPELPPVAGCDIRTPEFARLEAALLRQLIQRRETGFPQHPAEQVVEPLWIEGQTLPFRELYR